MSNFEQALMSLAFMSALCILDETDLLARLFAKEDVAVESMTLICKRVVELVEENRGLKKTVSTLELELGLKDVFGDKPADM